MRIEFSNGGAPGTVAVEVAANTDPEALGCSVDSRDLAWCRARIEQDPGGYADSLGWIQLVDDSSSTGGYALDPFEPLGEVTHPFCFFGFAPTLFDGPARPTREDLDWSARSFLAAIGEPGEAVAILGFCWGFRVRGGEVTVTGPTELSGAAWDECVPVLKGTCPTWRFAPGFAARRPTWFL